MSNRFRDCSYGIKIVKNNAVFLKKNSNQDLYKHLSI